MSYWNYRVLYHHHPEEPYFAVHEVFYNDDGEPNGYGAEATPIMGGAPAEIVGTLRMIMEGLQQPVLMGDDKFPEPFRQKKKKDAI